MVTTWRGVGAGIWSMAALVIFCLGSMRVSSDLRVVREQAGHSGR